MSIAILTMIYIIFHHIYPYIHALITSSYYQRGNLVLQDGEEALLLFKFKSGGFLPRVVTHSPVARVKFLSPMLSDGLRTCITCLTLTHV